MIHRLQPLMALLSTIAMLFLFQTNGYTQMTCQCPNSIDFDLDMGSNVPIEMDCLIDIDINPSTDPALAGEWFVDNLAIMPSSDDPSCFAPTTSITSIAITRVLMISPTFQVLPFTGNMVTGLTAGDELTIDFEIQLSNGECSEQQYSLDIVDNDPPVIDCPDDIVIECISDIPNVPTVTFMDNCFTGDQIATYEGQTATPDQCIGGLITRTWTAVDMFGFVDTCRQNIVITADQTPPTAATLPDVGPICALSDAPSFGSVFEIQNASGTDIMDCTPDNALGYVFLGDVLISGTPTSCPRSYRRSYSLTDDCGNVQIYGFDILVDDPTGPTIITQPQPVTDLCTDNTQTGSGFAAWVGRGGDANVQEDCGAGVTVQALLNGVDITANPNAFIASPCPNGNYVVTFIYTNECGTSTTSNPTTYTIDDRTTPTITDGADAVAVDCADGGFEADLANWVATGAMSTAVDACSGITLTSSINGTPANFSDILAALNASINNGVCQDNFPLEDGNPFTIDNAVGFVEVTFTYTDACGNPTQPVTKRFTVTDNDPPVINQLGGNLTTSCTAFGPMTTPEQALTNWLAGAAGGLTGDGCGPATFNGTVVNGGVPAGTVVLSNGMVSFGGASILDILSDDCGITGEVTVRFQATDDCGNVSANTYDATFSLVDNDPPTINTQPQNFTVNCNDDEAAALAQWTASRGDNPDVAGPGATGMDGCGMVTSYFFLTGTYDPNLDLDNNPSNNPGFNSITTADLSNGCGPTGTLSMTVFIVDECGNTVASNPASFSVIDDTPPNVTTVAQDASVACDVMGGAQAAFQDWLNNAGSAVAFDNCSGTSFTFQPAVPVFVGACGGSGSYTVEFFAQDECGLTTSAGSATFTIEDTAAPTVTSLPENYTVECGPGNATQLSLWAVTRGNNPDTPQPGLEAMDNCTGGVNTFFFRQGFYNPALDADNNPSNNVGFNTISLTDLAGDACVGNRSVTVDFFASDQCGNLSGPFAATFSLVDTQGPTITQQPTNGLVSCTGANGADLQNYIDNFGGATASDDCGGMITWTTIPANPMLSNGCGSTGSVDIIFVATDECGQSTQTNMVSFEVFDTTDPLLDGSTDISEECGPGGNFMNDQMGLQMWIDSNGDNDPTDVDASDNCSEPVVITFFWTDSNGNTGGSNMMPVYPTVDPSTCGWRVDVTFVATDACNNESRNTSFWEITDGTAPEFTSNLFTVQITADSNCDFDDSIVPTPTVFDACSGSGSLMGTGTGSVMITFVDTPTPVVPCTDNVFQRVSRTYTATDQCGNQSTATQLIEVRDFMPPTFSIPPNVTVDCTASLDPAFTGGGITDGEDNCSGFVVEFDDSMPGGCGGTGVITRTWTLTDGCGNANTQQQFITVVDNTPPAIVINADDFEYSCNADPSGSGLNGAFSSWITSIGFGAVANDNCSTINNFGGMINTTTGQLGMSNWFAFQSGTSTPAFLPGAACPSDIVAMVDFVVRDECGNSAVTSATFSVVDDTPPVISGCPTDITITTSSDGLGDCAAVYEFAPPTVIDGCADTQSPCGPIGFTSTAPATGGGFLQITGPVDPNVIVDPVRIDFTVPSNPTVAVSPVTLTLDFVNLDGEFINIGHTEFFRIYGEGMTLLGQTAPTATQCGDLPNQQFTIDAQTFNQWASDGVVTINMVPNNPGPGLENQGINNTCGSTEVRPSLNYDCSTPPAGGSLVFSVNGGAFMPATFPTISQAFFGPSSGFTGSPGTGTGSMTGTGTGSMTGTGTGTTVGTGMAFDGVSTVTFVATDCSGNSTSCTFNVTVIDDEAPMFANCPLDALPATVNTPDCNPVDFTLPRPDNDVIDNCELNAYNNTIMFNELRFTAHPNIDGFVMDTVVSSFSLAGSPPPSGDGVLNIMFKGDLDNTPLGGTSPQETLNIFGEGGVLLGTTGTNAGCGDAMMNVLQVTIPASMLQAWSADGQIDITTAPVFNGLLGFNNDGDPNNDDFGINPCVDPGTFPNDVNLTNVTDSGNSMLSVNLAFESTAFGYAVSGATIIPTTMFPSDGSDPVVTLNPGANTITYSVSDFAGNVDNTSCVRTIEVVNPNLPNPMISANMNNFMCPGEDVILTDNSGYMSPTAMWNWYVDNAPLGSNGPEDVLISTTTAPTITFPALSGSTYYHAIITDNLCMTDVSNVVNITTTIIGVSPIIVATPNPVCEGDDFLLSVSNPQGSFLTYRWEGPNGFTFNGQFPPAITNTTQFSEGLYSVFVTDTNGCEIPGSVFVEVGTLPETPTVDTNSPVCDGDDIVLSTSTVCDTYTWIGPDGASTGTLTNPLLVTTVGMTSIPEGNSAYDAGLWSVICTNAEGCSSESAQVEVVISDPIAVVPFVVGGQACEGDVIQLDVNSNSFNTYVWSGPNGFTSTVQNPIVTEIGLYTVVCTDANGCTGTGSIDVQPLPTPTITAISFTPGPDACVTGAEDLQFMVSVFPPESATNVYTYLWEGPNGFVSISRDAIVPNVSQADNGQYRLTVTGANGCMSEQFPIDVNVIDAPVTPVITVDEDMICEGEIIRIESTPYDQPGVQYVWDIPGIGDTITNVPTLIIDPATAADGGAYSLTVDVSGCVSNASGTIIVDVTPQPTQPVIIIPSIICEGEDLVLTIENPDPNADYQWTGPANFNSTSMPTTVFDVASINQGEYRVICILNGCESELSDPAVIDVMDTPETPVITHDGPICLDSPGEELTLSIVSPIPGATYEWFDDVAGGNSVGTSGLTPFITLNDFSAYTGNGTSFIVNFTAVASINGCMSDASAVATVEFNTIPTEMAFAGDDQNVCNQGSIFLNAVAPSVGDGRWIEIPGPTANIINPNDPNTAVTGLVEGSYIFRWILSNGGCEDYAFDDVVVVVNSENQEADGGGPYELCNATEFNLDAVAPITGNFGVWTQPAGQEALGITIVDDTDPNTLVTGLEAGNTYTFTWCLGNQGCGPDFDCSEVLVVNALMATEAFAGNNFEDCGDGVMLNATEPDECSGSWSTLDPDSPVIFDNPNDPNTTLRNIPAGENIFVWTLDCNECGTTSAMVTLTYEPAPIAVDTIINLTFGGGVSEAFDVTLNDNLPAGTTISIIGDGPMLGTLEDLGGGMFTYIPTTFGNDQFEYEVCSTICPDVCSTAVVTLRSLAQDDCEPPTIFTPNGDNYNDAFIISCLFELSKFPDNRVTIYNQWGDQVFTAQPYLNDWMGTFNGEDLPVGTYFYVVDLGDGSDQMTGFLVLER